MLACNAFLLLCLHSLPHVQIVSVTTDRTFFISFWEFTVDDYENLFIFFIMARLPLLYFADYNR